MSYSQTAGQERTRAVVDSLVKRYNWRENKRMSSTVEFTVESAGHFGSNGFSVPYQLIYQKLNWLLKSSIHCPVGYSIVRVAYTI